VYVATHNKNAAKTKRNVSVLSLQRIGFNPLLNSLLDATGAKYGEGLDEICSLQTGFEQFQLP
jgi:hypothetical protein